MRCSRPTRCRLNSTLAKIKRLLRWYTRQTCYLQALARGAGRIDLTGAVVDTDLPPHIRQQAQQEVERWRPHQAVRGESRSLGAAALLLTLAAAFPQTYLFLSAIQLLSNIISRTGEVTLVTDGERR